ncbi:uncharacterized protein LOC128264342 [Drosophila gunungcola]|uniref:UBA domain-containing protein n=1 Tax=Drosophila gunungcola TaxID=103775 RepID=A0A9P9YCT1_9MUSC|nr:uncharacterized protein LOC128264342 [Drosophila gunungcola]KAI8034593.1 hypothetical protein M5D96_012646 [Drosophila gunungcola]
MSQVEQMQVKSPPETGARGAGSPEETSSAAVATDASETERLVKLVMAMGYPEGEVRLSLARSNNNVQRAVQILVEGADDGESRKRRRSRQRLKQLRSSLLGQPLATDDAIVQMMRDQRMAQALREMVNESSVEAMQLLLAEEEQEEEDFDEGQEEEQVSQDQLGSSMEQASSSAENSPPSN